MDFFLKSKFGNFVFVSLVHLFAFILAYSLSGKTFFSKLALLFGISPNSIIESPELILRAIYNFVKQPAAFTYFIWYSQFVTYFFYLSIGISFVATSAFVFIYSFKREGQDMRGSWMGLAITLIIMIFCIAFFFSPRIHDAMGIFIWSFASYILYCFLPFYFSTVVLCDTTAFKSYEIKKFFNS